VYPGLFHPDEWKLEETWEGATEIYSDVSGRKILLAVFQRADHAQDFLEACKEIC
jgi:hypothetical protein